MQGLIVRIMGWYEIDYARVDKDHKLGCDYGRVDNEDYNRIMKVLGMVVDWI